MDEVVLETVLETALDVAGAGLAAVFPANLSRILTYENLCESFRMEVCPCGVDASLPVSGSSPAGFLLDACGEMSPTLGEGVLTGILGDAMDNALGAKMMDAWLLEDSSEHVSDADIWTDASR